MTLIKECEYDNTNLEYWDVVLFYEGWYRLGMVKSTYHDGNTDCSWHYVKVSSASKDLDLSWSDIIYKFTWDDAIIIKNLILTWDVMENKDEKMCELRNDIDYYKNEVNRYKKEVEINERILKEKEEEYEEYNKIQD